MQFFSLLFFYAQFPELKDDTKLETIVKYYLDKDKPRKMTTASELMLQLREYGKINLQTPTDILNTTNASISSTESKNSSATSLLSENLLSDESSDDDMPKKVGKRKLNEKFSITNPKKN